MPLDFRWARNTGNPAWEDPDPPFSPGVTVDSTTTISSGGSPDWHGRASIKRLGSGVLVLAYHNSSAHAQNDGALHIRFSDDNGATWTNADTKLGGGAVSGFPMNPSGKTANQDAGEPWLYVTAGGDLILHMWRVDYSADNDGTYQSTSSDDGETWSTAVAIDITGETNSNVYYQTDDDFVDPDTDDIYAIAREYTTGTYTASRLYLVKSEDDGATWDVVSTVMASTEGSDSKGGIEAGLEFTGDDRIVVMIRDTAHKNSYQRISTDMGLTWGALTSVTSTVGIGGRQRVYTKDHLMGEASWWEDPKMIMVGFVHQVSGDSQDRRNCIWLSEDAGATWTTPFYIDSTSEDAGYGDIFYDDDNDQWVVVTYQGTLAAASLKQYRLTITGW